MTNPLGILNRSALSENNKVSTAAAEVMRRLKNFSENVEKGQVEETLVEYMDNLCGMGYPHQWRMKVLKSTMLGYDRIMRKVDRGETARNREGKTTRLHRRWKRLMGPMMWFKQNRKNQRRNWSQDMEHQEPGDQGNRIWTRRSSQMLYSLSL